MAEKIHAESLETRLARLEERMDTISEHQETDTQNIQDIKHTLQDFLLEFSRYKGFVGGMLLVISCIGAAIKAIPFIGSLFIKQ
jgi:hypothetical protein